MKATKLGLSSFAALSCYALNGCDAAQLGPVSHGAERSATLEGMVLPGCGGSPHDDTFVGQVEVSDSDLPLEGVEVTVVFASATGAELESVVFDVASDGTFEVDSIPPEATALSAYVTIDGEAAGEDTFPLEE